MWSREDIRVIDGALPDPLFSRIVSAVRDIGDEGLKDGYNTTFWVPRNTAPANLAEEVIAELIGLAHPPGSYTGTEWWLGRLEHGEKLPMHFDRDLTRSRKFGQHEYPLFASILYLNTFPASPTVVVGQIPGDTPRQKVPDKPAFRESIDAVANRYVVFPGNLRHGIVPGKSRDGEEQMPRDRFRLSLLVNYWHVRPMGPICLDYDGSIYPRMQQGEVER